MLRLLIAGLWVGLGICAAAAETWPAPRVTTFTPDWDAARGTLPAIPGQLSGADRLTQITAIGSEIFPAIAQSPIPVLLPFAVADYAYDRAADTSSTPVSYMTDFRPTKFFQSGPTGYDATFTLDTREVSDFGDIGFRDPIVVQISGFNLLNELPEAKGAIPHKAGEFEKDFAGLKRQILESTLRYSFERYGAFYVVSIQCFDGGPQRRTRLSCRNAERVANRFMRALRFVGGNPAPAATTTAPPIVVRPDNQSEVFSYHPVGKLVSGTAMRSAAGDTDNTVYARMRFPAAIAPAYVNSQKFGRRGATKQSSSSEASGDSARYVWRDNFCERRDFYVGQCPSGRGHQGQDIRGASCDPRKAECRPYNDDVVAAREGMIQREAWNDSFFLVTNAQGERLRFRHLHMHPRKLDEDGIVGGRIVKEGDRLGTVGNYSRRPGLTSTHLHFEIQVPTRDGWVRINPYMTLIASYEHLIGARGIELRELAPQSADSQTGETTTPPAIAAAIKGDEASKAEPAVNTRRVKGRSWRQSWKARTKKRL